MIKLKKNSVIKFFIWYSFEIWEEVLISISSDLGLKIKHNKLLINFDFLREDYLLVAKKPLTIWILFSTSYFWELRFFSKVH